MNKKIITGFMCALLASSLLVGCGAKTPINENAELSVGLVTNIGTIDDKSFNQGAWEGITASADKYNIRYTYLQPGGETDSDALKEITNFNDAGYELIVAPGFKFGTTIYQAQNKYPNMKFLIIDSVAHNGDNIAAQNENTVSVLFKEDEAGFLAGVATALELKEGDVGFIGGMATEAVQKYNWGFQLGIHYANNNYGTAINMDKHNIIYQGTFTDISAGQQISAQLYDRGVDAIFCAAGSVGTGVIKEAREKALNGENVWVIGVDVDQYEDGIYKEGKSVILTSAMKKLSTATEDVITSIMEGTFKGGETLLYSVENNGVGIPEVNPNLSDETSHVVSEVFEKLKSCEIKIDLSSEAIIK